MAQATNTAYLNLVARDQMSGTIAKAGASTERLTKHFTKLSGAFQNAFQFYVRYRIFGLINRGIGAIENAIPGLIARGQEWAQTVDRIADSSGLGAEKSSLLAGSMLVMTGDTEGLTKALGALSQQVVNHGDVMQRYGIKTKNANGELLDSWTILKNVRRATSDLGNSFVTTAAARDLFSRGGQVMMDFLTMSDAQFKMLTRDVRESGVIMTEAGLQAADQWGRTQQRFELSISGIANQITMHVQPLLTRLVDGITEYIRKNMASIVGFVVQVVATVANFLAGLFDIDLDLPSFAERQDAKGKKGDRTLNDARTRQQQVSGEDAYTASLNRQIDAIDRQIAAMDRQTKAEDARRQHAELMKDVSDAKKELADLRGQGIFAAGMSFAEAELARQARAGAIGDAQKKVQEARKKAEDQARKTAADNRRYALQQQKAGLQERLSAHIKMLADQAAADREALSQVFGGDQKGLGKGLLKNIDKSVVEALSAAEIGKKWAEDFKKWVGDWFGDGTSFAETLKTTFDRLSEIANLVIDNWRKVAFLGGAIIGLKLFTGLAGFAASVGGLTSAFGVAGTVGGTTLIGAAAAAGLAVAGLGIAAVALKGPLDDLVNSLPIGGESKSLITTGRTTGANRRDPGRTRYPDFLANVNQAIANTGLPLAVFGLHKEGQATSSRVAGTEQAVKAVSTGLTSDGQISKDIVRQTTFSGVHSRNQIRASNTIASQVNQLRAIPIYSNISLYLDSKLALQLLNVPVNRRRTSTTSRVQ